MAQLPNGEFAGAGRIHPRSISTLKRESRFFQYSHTHQGGEVVDYPLMQIEMEQRNSLSQSVLELITTKWTSIETLSQQIKAVSDLFDDTYGSYLLYSIIARLLHQGKVEIIETNQQGLTFSFDSLKLFSIRQVNTEP